MKMLPINFFNQQNHTKIKQVQKPNLKNIQADTVSFGAMKRSAFKEFNLACVNIFKIPIEKFKSINDFYAWVEAKYEELAQKEYPARDTRTTLAREKYLNSWKRHLDQDEYTQNPALKLIIFAFLVKGLTPTNENIPFVCDQDVLNNTILEIQAMLKQNPKAKFDFFKVYSSNMKKYYEIPSNGWVEIPSAKKDLKNAYENMKKLQCLSVSTWCTKSEKTEDYIANSDFYILMENDKPRICIKATNGVIDEIQGPKNDNKIPDKYIEQIEKFINENNLDDNINRVQNAKRIRNEKIKIIKDICEFIINQDAEKILKYFGITTTYRTDGKKILSEYRQPSMDISFSDLGIDENILIENVAEISGNAIFTKSSLESLQDIERIGGYAYLTGENLEDIGEKLESIEGGACFSKSKIKTLKNLKKIMGDTDFSESEVVDTGELSVIFGNVNFKKSKLKNLGKIKEIFGDVRKDWSMQIDKSKVKIHGDIR